MSRAGWIVNTGFLACFLFASGGVDINFNFKWVGWLVVPYLLMHTLSLGPIPGMGRENVGGNPPVHQCIFES